MHRREFLWTNFYWKRCVEKGLSFQNGGGEEFAESDGVLNSGQ